MAPPAAPTTKPTRNQLRQQARTLDAFGPASAPVDIRAFAETSRQLASAYLDGTAGETPLGGGEGWDAGLTKKDKEWLETECGLDELVGSMAPVYDDPNLMSELKAYQHELSTPYGSLHAIHSLDRAESKPEPLDGNLEEDDEIDRRPKKRQKKAAKGRASRAATQAEADDIAVQPLDPSIDPTLQDSAPQTPAEDDITGDADPGTAPDDDRPAEKGKSRRVRKKKAGPRVPLSEKDEVLQTLVQAAEATGVRMLHFTSDTRFFVRTVGRPEINILAQMKYTPGLQAANRARPPVILTITFHPVVRAAVLASGAAAALPISSAADHRALTPRLQTVHVLSSQPLSALKDAVACLADHIPVELDKGEVVLDPGVASSTNGVGKAGEPLTGPLATMMVYRRGKWKRERWEAGAVFCIEGKLYGDRRGLGQVEGKIDYAHLVSDLLQQSLNAGSGDASKGLLAPAQQRTLTAADVARFEVAAKSMEEMTFEDLTIRVGEPYWMFHQGSCEHVWTIDEIRCLHPEDPSPFAEAPPHPAEPTAEPPTQEDDTPARRKQPRRRAPSPLAPPTKAIASTIADGYPITTFLSRTSSSKCRICDRDPASMVVVDDELCGDSPCYACEKCFQLLHAHEKAGAPHDYWVLPLLPEPT